MGKMSDLDRLVRAGDPEALRTAKYLASEGCGAVVETSMGAGRYPRIFSAVFGQCWAIMPDKLMAMVDFLRMKVDGVSLNANATIIGARAVQPEAKRTGNGVAVLPVFGVLAHRMNLMTEISGGTSTEILGQWFDAAVADKSVGTIVLDVDSPGGSVHGMQELSEKIFKARGKKDIVAVANDLAASAAYWVASAADRIVVTPGGLVGAVGTLAIHTESSKRDEETGVKHTLIHAGKNKVDGNPYEPLTQSAEEDIQRIIDEYYDQFVSDVARNRGISESKVLAKFGQGRVYGGRDATKRGMVDKVGTLDATLMSLGVAAEAGGARPVRSEHPSVDVARRRLALNGVFSGDAWPSDREDPA